MPPEATCLQKMQSFYKFDINLHPKTQFWGLFKNILIATLRNDEKNIDEKILMKKIFHLINDRLK